MKGQSSIEFMSLLALILLGSSILISDLERKSAAFHTEKDFEQAERLAEKVNYKLSYVNTHRNSTIDLDFSPDLESVYTLEIDSGSTEVSTYMGDFSFSTRYSGGGNFTINTSETYSVKYEGGVKLE